MLDFLLDWCAVHALELIGVATERHENFFRMLSNMSKKRQKRLSDYNYGGIITFLIIFLQGEKNTSCN